MSVPRKNTKHCTKCGVNRSLDSRLGWLGAAPRARVCNRCRKGKRVQTTRAQRVLETYGLTLTEVAEVFARQNFRCAICRGRRKANLDIDHSHKNGLVRGLLCKRCNRRLLPAALDNVEVLRAAIDYLERPPAQLVLGPRKVPDGSQA